MTSAEGLIQQIRHELEPLEAQLRDHPYLRALERYEIARDRLSVIVGEQKRQRNGPIIANALLKASEGFGG